MRKFDDETDSTAVVGRIRLPCTKVRGTSRLGRSVFEPVVLLPRLYQLERLVDYHPVFQAASPSIDVGSCLIRGRSCP
jgi:hypothetical protein